MRRTIAIAALVLAGLFGLASLAQAAPARPDLPTCLIANGGGGGHYTKALTCVELVADRHGDVGTGRYTAVPGSGPHALTVTVEYRLPRGLWVRLASATDRGRGELSAATRPVRVPRFGVTRACVSVDARPALCTH
ncbi:MAG TPA: hypothetical protein VHV49_11570 [Pseudonocardiaceae bacterium]|jgi:hypothetical protein|nr:hypothetical protein [Pseudonocardiaceae bacterium]